MWAGHLQQLVLISLLLSERWSCSISIWRFKGADFTQDQDEAYHCISHLTSCTAVRLWSSLTYAHSGILARYFLSEGCSMVFEQYAGCKWGPFAYSLRMHKYLLRRSTKHAYFGSVAEENISGLQVKEQLNRKCQRTASSHRIHIGKTSTNNPLLPLLHGHLQSNSALKRLSKQQGETESRRPAVQLASEYCQGC